MADNAGALAGRTIREYIAGTDGTIRMVHIRPHIPQTSGGYTDAMVTTTKLKKD